MRIGKRESMIATSRLFSSALIQELSRKGRSSLFANLIQTSELQSVLGEPLLVSDVFDLAFNALRREGVRDEYVYKSALVHRILLGRH